MAQRCKVLSGCFRKKLGQGSKQAGAQHEEKQCGEAKSKNSALCPWRCCSWSVLQTSVQATQKCDLHFLSRLQRQTCTHTQKSQTLFQTTLISNLRWDSTSSTAEASIRTCTVSWRARGEQRTKLERVTPTVFGWKLEIKSNWKGWKDAEIINKKEDSLRRAMEAFHLGIVRRWQNDRACYEALSNAAQTPCATANEEVISEDEHKPQDVLWSLLEEP